MKRNGIAGAALACMAFFASTTTSAQTTPAESAAEGQPKIEFLESEHDFGVRDAGPELETTFAFRNVGDAVLRIVKVKGG